MTPQLPHLTIVAGRPAAGKTTLARILARRLRSPLVSRDAIKEGMVNTLGDKGAPDGDLAQLAYQTFFANIELLLRARTSVVAEAAFQHARWAPKLEPLVPIASIRIVLCQLAPRLAQSRAQRRRQDDPDWDRYHNAPLTQENQAPKAYDPPNMDLPLLKVDTTDQYDPSLEPIIHFATKR